jgi:hypothetical protein
MMQKRHQLAACAIAVAAAVAVSGRTAHADRNYQNNQNGQGNQNNQGNHDDEDNKPLKQVFVIAMENHNWTQPGGPGTGNPQQIFLNPAAPFINSLVDGSSGISSQVSYATNYQNAGLGVHPSEPNYVWTELGTAGNSLNTDADPWAKGPTPPMCTLQTAVNTTQHLSAFITRAGKTWRSYQEDVNVDSSNTPLPMAQWKSPIFSMSGSYATGMNAYYYTAQFNYAPKHNPQVFFMDTNGGACPGALTTEYPPLQQLALDLAADRLADYVWITPNQFNDQHSSLSNGYGKFPNGDQASIAQGDNFLARIVPLIMASDAYKRGAAILLWWDESEGGDTSNFTLPFIVISKNAHKNVGGKPFASSVELSHSSFLRTMQEVFDVNPDDGFPFLGAAANANDLSSLFKPGVIHQK